MNTKLEIQLGNFTIFGYTKKPEESLKRRFSERLGINPKIIDFGNAGLFYFHTSYGDIAETEQDIALKLGFVRSTTRSPLSAQQLLDQRIANPQKIDQDAIHGNALIACFSKTEAKCVVFRNILSTSSFFYWDSSDELIGSDSLRCLVAVLDQVKLNEDIIPYHFMLKHAPGNLTYFQNVQRLFPGQLLRWQEGNLRLRCVQDVRFPCDNPSLEGGHLQSADTLYQELNDVVGAYIRDIERSNNGVGNLLSGGVDSSILQLILNEQSAPMSVRSFSYIPKSTPSFEFEIEYARTASEMLGTDHTFVSIAPEDYPDLMLKAVEILGQPVFSHMEPCKLALGEYLTEEVSDLRYFFVGQGADVLFGLDIARKIKALETLKKIPGSKLVLEGAGRSLKPFTRRAQTLIKGAAILSHSDDPNFFLAPTNTIEVYTNLDIVRRAFGDEAICRVLEYRRHWETQYLNSANYLEKVHVIDLLSSCHEIQVQSNRLFLANNLAQVYPFLDDEIVRVSLAIPPEIRYIRGLRLKPLLKDILEQRGLSAIARKPKGGSGFYDDLCVWMHCGPLHEMIRDVSRPNFLSQADFERLVSKPDNFLWSLLTFDLFQKRILGSN